MRLSSMIFGLVCAASPHAFASPEDVPLYDAELRFGYGLAVGGGNGMTSARPSPLTITALGAIAINDEPRMSAIAGLVVEALDRNAIGATAGVRLSPSRHLRLSAGGTWVFSPYTLWGATGSAGTCGRFAGVGLCMHAQLTTYFAGTDLAEGRTATQIQGVFGMVFDAL
ncbi:MAG: hypothetical protein KIT31_26710 [Deltaproteobacteria bacterium]|nr:hypothetical protein [Deltaproteobacteria bacterium]